MPSPKQYLSFTMTKQLIVVTLKKQGYWMPIFPQSDSKAHTVIIEIAAQCKEATLGMNCG